MTKGQGGDKWNGPSLVDRDNQIVSPEDKDLAKYLNDVRKRHDLPSPTRQEQRQLIAEVRRRHGNATKPRSEWRYLVDQVIFDLEFMVFKGPYL